jgi:hypothetical protein
MWLGEAPISLMLETSLVHPHTIVSMLINDLADIGLSFCRYPSRGAGLFMSARCQPAWKYSTSTCHFGFILPSG